MRCCGKRRKFPDSRRRRQQLRKPCGYWCGLDGKRKLGPLLENTVGAGNWRKPDETARSVDALFRGFGEWFDQRGIGVFDIADAGRHGP